MPSCGLFHNAQSHSQNASDVIACRFGKKWRHCLSLDIDEDSTETKKGMLSCKRLKETHTYEVLAKELEAINWDFGIENKIVHATTDNGSNFATAFNVYGETAETVEEESSDEERSGCSGGNVDEDTIRPVRLPPILEGDNDE